MKGRIIVFPEAGKVEIREEEVPAAGSGEVLCRARQSLVSLGTESHCLRGIYDPGTYWEDYIRYPFKPGYSMAAEVVAVGDGVTRHQVGDRVTSWAPHAEIFLQPQDQLFAVPDGVADEEAVWATLARTTQIGVRRAELVLGETAVVVGLGILGQLVSQYLALSGARHVIALDMSKKRLDLARAHGATHALNLPADRARDAVAEITGGGMADVVFDITGHPAVLAPASLLLRKLGRLVLLGDTPTPSRQHLGPRIVGDSIAILGIHGMMYPDAATPFNQWTAEAMTSLFFDYIRSGRMNLSPLITHRVSPLEADRVYHSIAARPEEALGVIFDWSRLPP
jgi:threonine dehydrogenase-like Zn-dependent dehydrogenase